MGPIILATPTSLNHLPIGKKNVNVDKFASLYKNYWCHACIGEKKSMLMVKNKCNEVTLPCSHRRSTAGLATTGLLVTLYSSV